MRDRNNTPSPNAGQAESVCAGALGIQLGGPVSYGNVLYEKKFIGDGNEHIKRRHICMAVSLLTGCAFMFIILYAAIIIIVFTL